MSDGTKATSGEISVSQRPALEGALPIVQDDTAVVRAQDSVTIPVMDNDSMAEGIPLVLDPGSVKVLNGEDAAFASGNVIRYVPQERNPRVEQVRVIEYAVYPIGMRDRAQTGRVSVTVKPLPTPGTQNQPPTARSFSASVVAGEPLTVTVPVSGVDADGDSVTVQGIVGDQGDTVDLSLGRVTSFGASTIKYEAYPRSAGTEVLHYQVADRFGATSTGFVRIGVVQPGDPQAAGGGRGRGARGAGQDGDCRRHGERPDRPRRRRRPRVRGAQREGRAGEVEDRPTEHLLLHDGPGARAGSPAPDVRHHQRAVRPPVRR